MKKLGSHVSFTSPNYLAGAAESALSYGADAFMIYLGAPQNTRRVDAAKMQLELYEQKYAALIPKTNILVHAPYIINPASVEKHKFAIEFLIQELALMNYLGLKQIVLHPGAFTKWTREEGLKTLVFSLKTVLDQTQNVEILIETMAGKGTEVGITLEELAWIIKEVNHPRLGICADTCHLWEAGYNVNKPEALIQAFKQLDLWKHVKAWHINNSKNLQGAHKDRHEQIAKGQINPEALKFLVNHPDNANLIKVLETPWEEGKPAYKAEINYLKAK